MSISAAQHLFNVMASDHVTMDSLGLLKILLSSNLMRMDEPVTAKYQTLPFGQALLSLAAAGTYTPQFYTEKAARALIDIDPQFFCQDNPGNLGYLWLEQNLHAWSRHEDRSRLGFSTSGSQKENRVDDWARTVFESLPQQHKENLALWKAALRIGLPSATAYLASHRPAGWAALDDKGKPWLATAEGAWAWEAALEAGLDPYAPTPKGVPFWRAMLPQASNSPAEGGSVRAAVECWVQEEAVKPGASDDLMDYIRRHAIARMGTGMGANAWSRLSPKEQVEYVQQLPNEWITWPRDGMPAWVHLALHREAKPSSWATTVSKNAGWMKHLAQDPLSLLALEMLKAPSGLPDKLPTTLDISSALENDYAKETLQACVKATKANPAQFEVWLDALKLSATTPQASAHSRSRPRL